MFIAKIMNELGNKKHALRYSYIELLQRHVQEIVAHKEFQ
jgi:hypothetical protein